MKQTEATEVVFSLLPLMRDTAPAVVLTKYAMQRRLSPAQLDKLGAVYNTASTLETLGKDRSAAPELLDVPQMVASYIRESGTAKRASWYEEPEKQAAAPEDPVDAELPNVWNRREAPQFKEAAAPPVQDLRPLQKKTFWESTKVATIALEEEVVAVSSLSREMEKVAKALLREDNPHLKYATLAADLPVLTSELETSVLLGNLQAKLAGMGLDIQNGGEVSAPPFVLARDRTGYVGQMAGAMQHLKAAVEARTALTQSLDIMLKAARCLADDSEILRQARKTAHQLELMGEMSGLFKAAGPERKEKNAPRDESDDARSIRLLSDYTAGDPKASLLSAGVYGLIGGTKGLVGASRDLRSGLGQDIPSYLQEFSQDGALGKLLAPYGEKNRRQADEDALRRTTVQDDTETLAIFKDLMIRDEILATKPPEQVFEALQSLRRAAPEITRDKPLLRLMLRQAMATQGVDIDSATAARKFEVEDLKRRGLARP